jgi:tyrosyl-tRNA synthetase (EC 6.1.1.1)
MDTDAYESITRNTAEVVTNEEIHALAESPENRRAYVGYEPSGVLHVGHMLTANKLIELQSIGFDIIVLLADVHAYLNGKGTFAEIRETASQMREQFIAYGLDSDQTEFILGSSFQFDEEYILDLHALEAETSLARSNRAMAAIKGDETATVAHAVYPLMQALDIVYLDVDLAIGGTEQRKVHMLARDTLPSIDADAPACLHTPLIADLTTGIGKMSSSSGVSISIEDDTTTLTKKIESAYCPPTATPDPSVRASQDIIQCSSCSSITYSRDSTMWSSSAEKSTVETSVMKRMIRLKQILNLVIFILQMQKKRLPHILIHSLSLAGQKYATSESELPRQQQRRRRGFQGKFLQILIVFQLGESYSL